MLGAPQQGAVDDIVQELEQTSPPLPQIAGYRLLRVINHGGMSTVYLGDQLALSREVAVKVMAPQALSDEVSRRRFENEVRTIARLEHPNVVTIHEVGRTAEGLPYYSMPHMSRGHLGQRSFHDQVRAGDESGVLAIARALLSALEYAHARGVVHRDVKAENVLFNDSERPLLADFGIALRRGFGPRVTSAGMAVGSTAYMAPEQARGEDVDGRADLYSLAVLIWEMLTGDLPYRASDALSMAVMHAQDPIPRLPPHLRHWQRFMSRALAKVPVDRFDNVAQMREALDKVQKRRPSEGRIVFGRLLARVPRRAFLWVPAALVVLAVLAWGLTGPGGGNEGFFRAAGPSAGPADLADPTESMLRPLPEAPVQAALERARRQLEARNLTAPQGDNAYESIMSAWQSDPGNAEVAATIAALTDAFSAELSRHLAAGNDGRAREYAGHAARLAAGTGTADSQAQQRLNERAVKALELRIERASVSVDAAAARAAATLGGQLGIEPAAAARLDRLAQAVPSRGDVVPGDPTGAVIGNGGIALALRPVGRDAYAEFANATGRDAALCRERASLLRVVAPRDWKSPGFEQARGAPVVCVSATDADAYAAWYSRRTGNRYRLPTAAEARQAAAQVGARNISLWQRDCGADCNQRQVGGRSWRSDVQQRPISAARGYDDVGFRLLREL